FSPTSTIVAGDSFPILAAQSVDSSTGFKKVRTVGSDDLGIFIDYPPSGAGSDLETLGRVVVVATAGWSGDMNGDGRVLNHDETEDGKLYKSDVPYFAMALSDRQRYEKLPAPNGAPLNQRWRLGDLAGSEDDTENYFAGNGEFDLDDIKGFAHLFDMST